jgi:glycosyltransferase involved in cell wall biosynthesis
MNTENKFNGTPSITLPHKPFFSIIVPCYNSGKYLPTLLDSIVGQNMRDDIEVILSDDHSTEPYDDVLEPYLDKICIKRVQTDYNFGPGNTRQRGSEYAEGVWMTFADHDDQFVYDTFKDVKKAIVDNNEQFYVITNFVEMEKSTRNIINKFEGCTGWTHGKFYNKVNMWDQFEMHYEKDIRSHEDIYICSQANSIMNCLGRDPMGVDIYTYVWYAIPTSITRHKYTTEAGNRTFLEHLFKDYIHSTADVYFDFYDRNNISREYCIESTVDILCYCYFYIQSFMFKDPKNYIRKNLEYAKDLLVNIKQRFGFTNQDIYDILAANRAREYYQVSKSAFIATGPTIPSMGLMEFLDYLDNYSE